MSRALVVVDYQVDFVDGSLGSDDALAISSSIRSAILGARADGDLIIFTMDTHSEDYFDTLEGRMLPVVHCIKGTEGWRIHPSISDLITGAVVLEKGTFGCAELMGYLKDCDEIELCGVATNICVLANAVIARTANPDARVVVRRDRVASYDRNLGESTLDILPSLQIEVL